MAPQNEVLVAGDFSITTVINTPPWYENCYIVHHKPSGRLLVIDPGGEATRIAAAVRALGSSTPEILLTHGHPDHLGAVGELQEIFPGGVCRAHKSEQPIIDGAVQWAGALMQRQIKPPARLKFFDGEPELSFGDVSVRVIFTPGHTPGGVCFVFNGFVFTGDTLFSQGVGRTDLPGGHGPTLVASITRLLEQLDDKAVLFSGHGPRWTTVDARPWWRYMVSEGYM
ncbi:MAG: MBL fold metallo-hydrolase [Rhodospirillaceae bacterium]